MNAAGQLVIGEDGAVMALYSDAVPFRELGAALGEFTIRRASHVEPTDAGKWEAYMAPSGGGVLGPFDLRQQALDAEIAWLQEHVL